MTTITEHVGVEFEGRSWFATVQAHRDTARSSIYRLTAIVSKVVDGQHQDIVTIPDLGTLHKDTDEPSRREWVSLLWEHPEPGDHRVDVTTTYSPTRGSALFDAGRFAVKRMAREEA